MELSKTVQKKAKNPVPVIGMKKAPESNDNDLCARIAVRAYYKAESRGYEPGHEIQDWLEAEAEEAEQDK